MIYAGAAVVIGGQRAGGGSSLVWGTRSTRATLSTSTARCRTRHTVLIDFGQDIRTWPRNRRSDFTHLLAQPAAFPARVDALAAPRNGAAVTRVAPVDAEGRPRRRHRPATPRQRGADPDGWARCLGGRIDHVR